MFFGCILASDELPNIPGVHAFCKTCESQDAVVVICVFMIVAVVIAIVNNLIHSLQVSEEK